MGANQGRANGNKPEAEYGNRERTHERSGGKERGNRGSESGGGEQGSRCEAELRENGKEEQKAE